MSSLKKLTSPGLLLKKLKNLKIKLLVYDILMNNEKIIIDLSSCEYIDSTFLGALVVILKKMAERSGEIKYIIPQPSALYLFKITGLYGVLNLYRTREEAIESFV